MPPSPGPVGPAEAGPVGHAGAGPDFVVLTGFLGSGKTTLLRDVLAGPDAADTAVIVNEVCEIGLDGALLRESGGVPMAMLANGCVCCAMAGDLAPTIDALVAAERTGGQGQLRRIVLETSGLSKPGPVLRQLASLAEHRMRVSVVATYDSARGLEVAAFEEAAAQWAAAHRLVLTKADAVSPERLAAAAIEAAGINPLAEVAVETDRATLVAAAFAPLAAPSIAPSALPLAGAPHPRLGVHLARPRGPLPYDALASWLDDLAGALGERLLRLKGLVRVEESEAPLLVQSVGTLFSAPRPFRGPMPAEGPFVVIITRDAGAEAIAEVPGAELFRLASLAEPGPFARRRPGLVRSA